MYKIIDQKTAYEMMKTQNVVILDVRTIEEFNESHICNAINTPLQTIETHLHKFKKEDTLLVYCRSGVRSKQACEILAQHHFQNIFEFGGIITWEYEVE